MTWKKLENQCAVISDATAVKRLKKAEFCKKRPAASLTNKQT